MASQFGGSGFGPSFGGGFVISAAELGSLPRFVHVDENGPAANVNPIRPLPIFVVQGMSIDDYRAFNA